MNDIPMGGYISIMLVTFVALVLLAIIVLLQQRKIRNLQTPKYGFLGKTVTYSLIVALFTFGSLVTFTRLDSRDSSPGSVSVSDVENITLVADYELIDSANYLYKLYVVPYIDGIAWRNFSFTFNWTITFPDGEVREFTEEKLTSNHFGGVVQQLQIGKNTINVTLTVNNRIISDELSIQIP